MTPGISSLVVRTVTLKGSWRIVGFDSPPDCNMTDEEKKQRAKESFHKWYWENGGKEKLSKRRREVGPYKWGTAKDVPSKVY